MATTIKANQFDEQVIQEEQPVVVDFFADWCAPCKQYSSTFSTVAEQHKDVKFVKVDVGENPNLAMQYGIRSVPTTGAFKGGELVEMRPGAISEDSLTELMEKVR